MRILLLCSFGVSVDVLKNSMMKAIKAQELAFDIRVSALSEASIHGKDADIILLTPQVRFNLSKMKQLFPKTLVTCIKPEDFKEGNGSAVIEMIKYFQGNEIV